MEVNPMKAITFTTVLTLLVVALSGCTDSGGSKVNGPTAVAGCVGENCGELKLSEGEGGISGLVIDDRLRPLGEARILLLPLGLDTISNDNGEFGFVGLKPGAYTIKVQKAKHEAAPKRVDVTAGEFSEAILDARRTSSDTSVILTQEYAVFVPCAVDFIYTGLIWNCGTDLSGDNARYSFEVDYTDINNVTWLVAEAKINQVGDWNVQVRHPNGAPEGGERYAVADLWDTDYVRITLQKCEAGETVEECPPNTVYNGQSNNVQWLNDKPADTLLFLTGEYAGTLPEPLTRGLGARLGTKAQFVHSLFLGEPEVVIDTYAILE